jgi:hypothetical protein
MCPTYLILLDLITLIIFGNKSPGTDQILVKTFQTGGKTLHPKIHKFICSTWNKKELPQQWKGYINVPIYKKGYKTDYSTYRRTSLLPTTYKISSSILISRLTPYVEKITVVH